MLRVGIIDDSSLCRAGLRGMLQDSAADFRLQSPVSVVGEGKRAQAAALIRTTRPDLLISGDTYGKDSLSLVESVARRPASPAVLVIAERIAERDARTLLARGAAGVLLHRTAPQHLTWALIAAVEGSRALAPEIADAVVRDRRHPVRGHDGARERVAELSTREREVLTLLSDGLANRAIAQALHISPETVKGHVRAVCAKLKADNRMQAARIAWQADVATFPAEEVSPPSSGRG